MMKNIKDITISIFAVIGFVAIITAFTNQPEQANQPTVPESHVWEMHQVAFDAGIGGAFLYNKVTGEVRGYNSGQIIISSKGVAESIDMGAYVTFKEYPLKEAK